MENTNYLYETLNAIEQAGLLNELPDIIKSGLSRNIELREY